MSQENKQELKDIVLTMNKIIEKYDDLNMVADVMVWSSLTGRLMKIIDSE
jgi:hypothetical protein